MNAQRRGLLPSTVLPSGTPEQPSSSARTDNITNPLSRTSHACDRCRHMRTKCTGDERCSKCVMDNTICTYGDRKRERNKKDILESRDRIRDLEIQVFDLVNALRTTCASPNFPSAEFPWLSELLAKVRNPYLLQMHANQFTC